MASSRRIGAPDARNRAVLLDAAERLMFEEGYAAVTSRRIARKAGLKSQLVHYYFRTMDDLFLAVFRRRAEEVLQRQAEALASAEPLRALWEFNTEAMGAALTMEFTALANHRKAMWTEIAQYAERFRTAQIDALSSLMERYGISPGVCPPSVATVVMTSVARMVLLEQTLLGMSGGHTETFAFVDRHIRRLESDARRADATIPTPGTN